jgi:hypothetical protein
MKKPNMSKVLKAETKFEGAMTALFRMPKSELAEKIKNKRINRKKARIKQLCAAHTPSGLPAGS